VTAFAQLENGLAAAVNSKASTVNGERMPDARKTFSAWRFAGKLA
jgi:hypothetical protein